MMSNLNIFCWKKTKHKTVSLSLSLLMESTIEVKQSEGRFNTWLEQVYKN